MEEVYINDITSAINGKLVNCTSNFLIDKICINISKVTKGSLFFGFKDSKYEYTTLLQLAFERGAAAVVIQRGDEELGPQILVDDIKTAYNLVCTYYRKRFDIPVIAVTGSCGKTSTKDLVVSVMKGKYNNICKTPSSFNSISEIIPRILGLNNLNDACVLEMGFGGYFGQIKRMTGIARPTISIITNIGTSHIKNLSSKQEVFEAKMEIASYLDKDGILIVNGDDEYLSKIKDKPYRIIRTSILGNGDYNGENIIDMKEEGVEFTCRLRGINHKFRLTVPGVHNVYNALAAIAIGDVLNVEVEKIKEGIYKFKTEGLTMQIIQLRKNIKLIVDCFNANLASMKSAIDVLRSIQGGRKIAVLGDMLELGSFSEEVHREVGKYLEGRVDVLVAVGKEAKAIYDESKAAIESFYFSTKEEACSYLKDNIIEKDCILIKASRHLEMERIAHYLRKELF